MTNQGSLFPIEKQKCYGQLARERSLALALSEQVKADALAVFRAHPGEWLWFHPELQAVKDKYNLGFDFNRTIDSLERDGLLERRHVYFGATSPVSEKSDLAGKRRLKKGEKPALPYLGFSVEHRIKELA